MRLFIAIVLEPSFFTSLREQIPTESAVLRLPSESHLTLKFLGEVKNADHIKKQLSAVVFSPFQITFTHVGCFPSRKEARIVWAGIQESSELRSLQQDIEEALADIPSDKPFHPHVTLARVRVLDSDAFSDHISKLSFEPKRVTVKQFSLIESSLTPTGPVYTTLATFHA
jgi:2'-5' RNA ligase